MTGFMGAGKSLVGRILAQKLNRTFVDTDALIEKKAGLAVTDIFEKLGEASFRKFESETVTELSQRTGLVVSLGGGAVLDEKNRTFLQQGLWVFIDPPFEILKERIMRRTHRPLAKSVEQLEELYKARRPFYEMAPIHVVETGDPEDVCQEALKKILSFRITE